MLYDIAGVNAERVMLVGLGRVKDLTPRVLAEVATSVTTDINKAGLKAAELGLFEGLCEEINLGQAVRAITESIGSQSYRYNKTLSKPKKPGTLKKVTLNVTKEQSKVAKKAAKQGAAIVSGVLLARTLGDLPGNICTPTYLAKQAKGCKKNMT